MTNLELKSVLDNHHIKYVEQNNMIIALGVFTYKGKARVTPVNVTGWAEPRMKTWLGY